MLKIEIDELKSSKLLLRITRELLMQFTDINNVLCVLLLFCIAQVHGNPQEEHSPMDGMQSVSIANETDEDNSGKWTQARTTQSTSARVVKFYAFTEFTNATDGLEIPIGNVRALQKAGFRKSNALAILVHGFGGSYRDFVALTNAYKDTREDVTVIRVNYEKLSTSVIPVPGSFISYFSALKNVRTVGRVIVSFIQFVIKAGYLEGAEKVHLIGFSLGCHVGGSAGYQMEKASGKKLGRITGLDPAGPFMKLLSSKDRLSSSKAAFVDVLHTNSEFLGTAVPLGTIDFYANGGKGISQKQCLDKNPNTIDLFCPHLIAIDYFEKSIRGAKAFGCPCRETKIPAKIPCPRPKLNCKSPALLGEYGKDKYTGKYYVPI